MWELTLENGKMIDKRKLGCKRIYVDFVLIFY